MKTVKLYCFCQDYPMVAARVEGYNLRNTVLNFIRLFMAKTLALQYSWSGLGLNRQRKKKALGNHRLVVLLESECCMQLNIVLESECCMQHNIVFTFPRSLLTLNVSTSFTLTRRYQCSSITRQKVFRSISCEQTTYTKFIKRRCLHHVSSLWHKFA